MAAERMGRPGTATVRSQMTGAPEQGERQPDRPAPGDRIQNFASNLAGVLGATTTGALVAADGGSFVAALVLSGVLALVGAFSYPVIVQRIEPLPIRR